MTDQEINREIAEAMTAQGPDSGVVGNFRRGDHP